MPRTVVAALLLGWVTISPAPAQQSDQDAHQDAGANPPATLNLLVADARERGFDKCLKRLASITGKLLSGAKMGAYVLSREDEPNDGIYTAMVSRQTNRGGTQMVSISVSPDDDCTASYEITTVWTGACGQIGRRLFSDYTPKVKLPGNVVVRSASDQQQVYMVPLPGGCLTIQKATLYEQVPEDAAPSGGATTAPGK